MTEFNIQQKQFIQEYKTSHHLENKSDEQIMLFIQKDMQTNGVVYPGFENLVKPQNKPAYTGQIFGNSTTSNDMAGVAIEYGGTTTATKEPEKEITTDENGNEVAVVKNGDEIVEATLSQTDSNGNKLETIVSYENGKPVKQIKKQNGNVSSVTKFKYNEPTENMPFPSVTVETIDGGKNKIITTALETDKYGNVDQEDFISRKTISRAGTETTVIIGSEYIKEDKVKIDGKKVSTLYNGTNLADFDNNKLHRVAQETEIDGVKRYAEYDGKGNTKTTVQNGESPALIAQKFNVKEQALMRLNPQKGKNAITQVGADILIPGEFNADSYPMRVRKSKEESLNKYSQFEARRLTKEINTEDVQNTKLSKSYNNVYELAKDNLIKSGVKNPSNQQVNDEANKLILLNGKNVNLKAGASVKVAKSLTNSKQASELTKYGFQASAENRIFFQKFNALNPQQKQNVLSAIQYCKSQNITNPSDIKAKVLETLGINLFDSDKKVPMVAENNYGVMAYPRNSKPISIETFVKDHLKLDIKSEPGKTVLDRLSQVEQSQLNKISAKDFKGFNNKSLDGVASMLETVGVQIRTQSEINVKNNTPRAKAEKEKRAVRTAAAENIALAYDNAINVIKNYQGNQGWMNVAFYREKLGQLLDKVNPTDVATCFDAVIKRLEKEKQFAVSRLKTASANESEFKQAFKNLTGKDYNENDMKNFIAQASKEGADWTKAYDKAFGDRVVKYATDKVNFQQYVDGAGDIVLMLLGTEAIGKGVALAGGKVATKLAPYVPKVLSNLGAKGIMTIGNSTVTVGKVTGNMAASAATFTAWDATKNYINLKTKDIQYTGEDAVKEWKAYKEGNVESGKFGAFAGLLNSTVVGKVVNGTMKLFEKPVAKALQGVTKTLEKGEASGADVMKTFMAKQTPGLLAQTAGAVAEVAGFTMYETANEITKELLQTDANGERHLPKDLTEEGLTNYLWKHLKGQAVNLGEIKAISKLIFMHKGAIVERERMMNENLSKCEMLSKVKVQKAEVDGAEIYAITTPNGNRKIARSPEDVVAYCNVLMQMDMAMNSKVVAEEANPNAPKGMNVEEDALLKKATKENPAEVVAEKVKKQWQQTDIAKNIPTEKVDLFNLDTKAGLNEPAPEVKDEVTSLIFTGKLKASLTQHYNELGNVFKDIAKNRSADFKKLAEECGSDKEAFCEGVVSILSEEIGMKGFEPKIEMKNLTGEADGQADWTKGTIYINSTANNVKNLVGLISHEYVHMLQYRDILAQYGEKGLREVIMNANDIPQEKKESQLSEILQSPYTKKLLDNYDNLKHSPENSLNEYIIRIYKDEFANGIDPNKDMKGYTNQGVEREAYHLGSEELGNNTTQLDGLTLEKEVSMKDLLARMRAKLRAGQTSQDSKVNTTTKKPENFVVNEDGSITFSNNTPKGIVQSEITSENFEQEKDNFINEFHAKVIKELGRFTFAKLDKISTPEDLAAVKEFWKWANTEEGKKQFSNDSYDIIDRINANNITDFKELVETINGQKDLSDDIKHSILYDAVAGESIKETKEFIQGIDSSDLTKLNELETFDKIMLSGSSTEQKAKLDFYKEIKTGKYNNIIKDDNIFKHVLYVGTDFAKTKALYDTFAGENISKECFEKIKEGLENSDIEAIKQLYSQTKDLMEKDSDMNWLMFRNLKQEDIPAKIEILNTLKSAKATNKEICETLNKTTKENLDVARALVQKAFANGDEKAEKYNVVIILNKLSKGVYSKKFVEKNAEALLHLDGTCIRNTTETNIELARKISENKEISSFQVDEMLKYATDEKSTQKLINNLDNGITKLPEIEVMNQLRMDFIEIIKKHLPPEDLQKIEKSIEDKEEFEKILIGKANSRALRDIELSTAEEKVANGITRIATPLSFAASPMREAGLRLEKYFADRNQNISDMNYSLENAQYKDEATKQQTLAKFNDLYPLLSNDELKELRQIYLGTPEKERLNIDYSLIAKREIIPLLRKTQNYDYNATEKALEFLNCSDAEFKQKKHNLETRTQELRNEWEFSKWKRMLNMPEVEFNRLKIPFEERTETPVDIKAYEAQMREKMSDRITYDPIEAAELIEKAEKKQTLRNEIWGNDYKPDKINAFEKLSKKAHVAVTPLPATGELMGELRKTGHVKLSIPNEGGVKVKPYDAVIHPEDDYRLNVTQDAGIKIRYGTKLQWSNFKIARDLLQNYYDGHGHTLEGVNIEVNKTIDGKYKIKISGESSWDYSHLDQMGSSTKHDPLDAGGYGEGTRAVAVSLLSKADITNVKYASGDWAMTYGRSSDDLKSAYMTQTLSKNSEKVKGSTVEFETTNADIAHKLLEAKDYFNHPHNPDFKNLDFENEFFGFKLKDDGAKGNLYLIQRYETDGESNNGLRGATIVFKTQPNHPTLVEKSGGEQFELGTGVDRAQIPSYDVNRILSRYIKTMTDEELTQTISSMEKFWGEGGTEKDRLNGMYVPFIKEAHRRGLGIDFKDAHYVYLDKPSPSSYDMAKNLGYKIADMNMKEVGMQSFNAKDESKLPHQPTEEQSKEIRLLEEGVRIIQECTDLSTKDLLNSDEVTKPTYMFSEGDHGTGAKAIIEAGEYQGHWMRDSHLLLQNYVGNLATFLHEISHKSGGDESEVFSKQLTKLQSHITNAIMHNPNALKKFQTLSKMFDEVRSQEFNTPIKSTEVIQDKSFTPEQYKQHIDNLLSVAPEYKEYVEPEAPKEPKPMVSTGDENSIGSGNSKKTGKIKLKSFEENKKLTSRFNIAGIKRFAKSFINKILRHNPSKIEEDGGITLGDDSFASFTIDAGVAHFDKPKVKGKNTTAKEEKHYKYEAFIPSKHESYTTLKSSDSMMKELDEKGSVALSISNAGGLNPKISEIPSVEKDNDFNKTVSAQMTLSYAKKRNWSNEKIARDLMQNFYDGNGHTLEGVDLKVKQNDDGTYTIRIDGKGIYNYEHLKRLGGSDKDDPRDAGGFGEGSRILAGSLLAKGTNRVRFACKDWQMDFTTAENARTHEECVMRTLTKSDTQLDGNYVEFDTNDKELVEKIMDSKNYFYSPNNPDFRDLDIENEFFGFKVSPNKNGNLYYIQRFQTPDKKMDNGLQNMTLIFKQAAFGENFQNKAGYTIDLNTTRDRMAIEPEQMSELTRAYAKTLPDADLVKAISDLEPIFTSGNCNSDKFRRENKENNLSYQFAQSIIHEAASRGIKLDFEDKRIVYVKESSEWRTSLSSKEEAFFKKEGYIFANMGTEIGIEDAESLYAKLHRPHSIKPNEQQAKQLQILNEAVKLITENDKFGLFPKEETQLYAFDETSNIESKTGYYAAVNSGNLDGVFINTKNLQGESFPTMLTNVLCEMLEDQTNKALSSYSYNQTALIRSQLNTLITQPQIVEKLNILEQMYKEQQK